MELEIWVSCGINAFTSPCEFVKGLGVSSGDPHIRLKAAGSGTRMFMCCDHATASHIRRTFSQAKAYAHRGEIIAVRLDGMRPAPLKVRRINLTSNVNRPLVRESALSSPTLARHPLPSLSKIEAALTTVSRYEDDGLLVPGVGDLHVAFLKWACPVPTSTTHGFSSSSSPDDLGRSDLVKGKKDIKGLQKRRHRRLESNVSEAKGCSTDSSDEDKESSCYTHSRGECNFKRGGHRHRPKRGQQHLLMQSAARREQNARACLMDVTLAFRDIYDEYPDAPGPVSRTKVILLLAKLYTDGDIFSDNGSYDVDTLDRIGITQFVSSKMRGNAYSGPHRGVWRRWMQLLHKVSGYSRKLFGFGHFVLLYAAAAKEEHEAQQRTVVRGGEGWRKDLVQEGHSKCQERGSSLQVEATPDMDNSCSVNMPTTTTTSLLEQEAEGKEKQLHRNDSNMTVGGKDPEVPPEERPQTGTLNWADTYGKDETQVLEVLFPDKDKARRAFNHRALFGSGAFGRVSVEGAVALIQDAGRSISPEKVWRWCRSHVKNNKGYPPGGCSAGDCKTLVNSSATPPASYGGAILEGDRNGDSNNTTAVIELQEDRDAWGPVTLMGFEDFTRLCIEMAPEMEEVTYNGIAFATGGNNGKPQERSQDFLGKCEDSEEAMVATKCPCVEGKPPTDVVVASNISSHTMLPEQACVTDFSRGQAEGITNSLPQAGSSDPDCKGVKTHTMEMFANVLVELSEVHKARAAAAK